VPFPQALTLIFLVWQALRGKAEAIRSSALDQCLAKIGELDKKQVKLIEELSRGIMNKLLHGPMMALRCDGCDADKVGETLANMEALERMFELSRFDPNIPITAPLGKPPSS
jgi:glutamyl-tRNA reductase